MLNKWRCQWNLYYCLKYSCCHAHWSSIYMKVLMFDAASIVFRMGFCNLEWLFKQIIDFSNKQIFDETILSERILLFQWTMVDLNRFCFERLDYGVTKAACVLWYDYNRLFYRFVIDRFVRMAAPENLNPLAQPYWQPLKSFTTFALWN